MNINKFKSNIITPTEIYTLNNEEWVVEESNERTNLTGLCRAVTLRDVMDVNVLEEPSALNPLKLVILIPTRKLEHLQV